MKKLNIILTLLFIAVLPCVFLGCDSNKPSSSVAIDTSKYTDVIIQNSSTLDSIEVYVTLQSQESIVGLFGMDSSNIYQQCTTYIGKDTIVKPCIGKFWAKKGIEYHLNRTKPIYGVIVTFGVMNQQCQSAIQNGYSTGINNFEFTVNTWCQDGVVLGKNESFDITLVDGLHSVLKQSVTSFGPRSSEPNSANLNSFWDYGVTDSTTGNLLPFQSSQNSITLSTCVNIPGVYPYGCDWGYKSYNPPKPVCFPVHCSTKWGNINTCQTNRQGQGGQVKCEFLGYVPKIAKK